MSSHPLLADIDLNGRIGLEIGALHHPVLTRTDAKVLYVDHASTEDLRTKYAGDEAVGEVVDVDVVWGDRPLGDGLDEAIGPNARVDFVVASHVLEHIPDPVGWLNELAGVLRPGGVIALSIPDKRYCFDVRRRPTDVSEVIEAHLMGRKQPPLGATFDFWTKYDQVDTAELWAGAAPPPGEPLRDDEALERTRAAAASGGYSDVHCWVLTPGTILEVLRRLFDLDLVPSLCVRSLNATAPGSLEFYLVLERLDDDLIPSARRAKQQASVRVEAYADLDERSSAPVPTDQAEFVASPREQRAILAKRRIIDGVRRRVLRRVR